MALFTSLGRNGRAYPRRPVQYTPQLPPPPTGLSFHCHSPSHPLPVAMVHIGNAVADNGVQQTSVWACPLCNHREGWVWDWHTGRPRALWRRPGI